MTNTHLKKRDDESPLQYDLRICSNRTREGLSWTDVADILNKEHGKTWGESKYRKWFTNFSAGVQYAQSQQADSDDVLDELEMKKIELLEERKKLTVIRSQYNEIAREKGYKDLLFEQIREGFQSIDTPNVEYDAFANVNEGQSHILNFGDIHYGKEFVGRNNEYSEEIAMNRMNELIPATVDYLNRNEANKLDVINLADSIEGMTLRISQLRSLQSGFVDQVIKFSKFYADWISRLSKYTKIDLHHISSANHSELRPHNSGRGEYPAEDMERIIGMYMQDVLKNHKDLNVHTYENGIAEFERVGFNFTAMHGHQLKNPKNGIKDLSVQRRRFVDFLILGHRHHSDIVTIGEGDGHSTKLINVPSIMGTDDFAESLFAGSKPEALITTFTKNKGLTDTHHIVLT